MNYCVRCGVWQAALSPCISYLLREAICSSERPPSSSFIINNLSFSSFGCTGKLLRKISVGTIRNTFTQVHTHSVLSNSWNNLSWQQLSPPVMKNSKRIFRKQKGCVLNYLYTWSRKGQMHADLHCTKPELMGFSFYLINLAVLKLQTEKKVWIMGAVAAGMTLITATYSHFDWVAGSRVQLQC